MQTYNVRTPHLAAASFTIGAVTTQLGTIIPGAARSFIVQELDFEGAGTASAFNELGLYTVNAAGVTPSNALTFANVENPPGGAPAFSGTGFFTYGTQPTASAIKMPMPLNSNGQRYFWRCRPNLSDAIVVPGGTAGIAVFPISGAGTGVGRIQIGEF